MANHEHIESETPNPDSQKAKSTREICWQIDGIIVYFINTCPFAIINKFVKFRNKLNWGMRAIKDM